MVNAHVLFGLKVHEKMFLLIWKKKRNVGKTEPKTSSQWAWSCFCCLHETKFSNGTEPLLYAIFAVASARLNIELHRIASRRSTSPRDPIVGFMATCLESLRRRFNSIWPRLRCNLSAWSTAKATQKASAKFHHQPRHPTASPTNIRARADSFDYMSEIWKLIHFLCVWIHMPTQLTLFVISRASLGAAFIVAVRLVAHFFELTWRCS